MYKNYRITISRRVYKILENDLLYFNLSSMNDLCSRIITNSYREFPINFNKVKKLSKILSKHISQETIKDIIKDIIKLDVNPSRFKRGIETKQINLKETSETIETLRILDKLVLEYDFESLVAVLREMLNTYANMRIIDKEYIVLKSEINKIKNSSQNNYETTIIYHSKKMTIHPYKFINPIDDYSLYLLAHEKGTKNVALLKVSDIKIELIDELTIFQIPQNLQELINHFTLEKTSIYNDEITTIIKNILKKNNLKIAFPYLVEEIRNYNNDSKSLINLTNKKVQD